MPRVPGFAFATGNTGHFHPSGTAPGFQETLTLERLERWRLLPSTPRSSANRLPAKAEASRYRQSEHAALAA